MNLYRKPVNTRCTAHRVRPEFPSEPGAIPVLTEPAIAVDWARRDGREKEQEGEELAGGKRSNRTVSYAEDHVQAAERHVRDPQEPHDGAWNGQRQETCPDQGEQGQQERHGEGPVPRGERSHPQESLSHDPLEDTAGQEHPDHAELREPAGGHEAAGEERALGTVDRQEVCDGSVLDDQHCRDGEQDPRAREAEPPPDQQGRQGDVQKNTEIEEIRVGRHVRASANLRRSALPFVFIGKLSRNENLRGIM